MATVAELFTIIITDYLDNGSGTAKDLWDHAFLFRALNEAQEQACNRTNIIYDDSAAAITKINLVNGTATYKLDQRITVVDHVMFDSIKCTHVSKEEIEKGTPGWRALTGMTGKTIQYVIRGRTIRFVPSPNIDDAGKKVYLEVFRRPLDTLSDCSDSPEIPEEYHRSLIYWVLHEAYRKQDADTFNQERADYFLNKFNEIFGEYISAEIRVNNFEQPISMMLHGHNYTPTLTRDSQEDWI